jgi:hypothetical protein
LSVAGLAAHVYVEVGFIEGASACRGSLIVGKRCWATNTFLILDIPYCGYWAENASPSSIFLVCRFAFTLLSNGVPNLIGIAGKAGEGFCVPNGVTGNTDVFGINVWLSSGATAKRTDLIEDETLRARNTCLVLDVPNVWSWAFNAGSSSISFELTLALAFFGNTVPCLIFWAHKTCFSNFVPNGVASLADVRGIEMRLGMRAVTSSCFFVGNEASRAGQALGTRFKPEVGCIANDAYFVWDIMVRLVFGANAFEFGGIPG